MSTSPSSLTSSAGGMAPWTPNTDQQPTLQKSPGFFGKLGTVLKTVAPYIPEITAHLAAAAGNYAPLEDLQQQRDFNLRSQLAQSQLDNQSLNRQLLQKQVDNYRSPEEVEAMKPPTRFTAVNPEGDLQYYDQRFNPQTRAWEQSPVTQSVEVSNPAYQSQQALQDTIRQLQGAGSGPSAPPVFPTVPTERQVADRAMQGSVSIAPAMPGTASPTVMQQRPLVAAAKLTRATQSVPMQESPTGYGWPVFDQFQRQVRVEPGAPPPSTIIPGMNRVDPLIAGQIGPIPNPSQYKNGLQDQQFKADLQTWSKQASDLREAQQLAVANARGAAFGANRPLTAYDPTTGQDVITTFNRGIPGQTPGSPLLAGNQSGALGIAGKRATIGELDTNLAQMQKALPALDSATTLDRASMAAALTPGTSKIGQMIEGVGMSNLSPEHRSVINTIRNLRQGAMSLRNIMNSAGVGSDYRVGLLEAEMPNEQDLMGSSQALREKLQTFQNVYESIKQDYPSLVTSQSAPSGPPTKPGLPKPYAPEPPKKVLVEGKDF